MKLQLNISWTYVSGIDYDYDSDRPWNCDCGNDMHRCSTITNARVTDVNSSVLADYVASHCQDSIRTYLRTQKAQQTKALKAAAKKAGAPAPVIPKSGKLFTLSSFERYGIDRIVMGMKLGTEDFDVRVTGGYYGQEVDGVELDNTTQTKLMRRLTEFLSETDINKRVRMLLTWEYGYLLDELKTAKFAIETLDLTSVATDNGYRKLDTTVVDQYSNRLQDPSKTFKDLPIGIVVREDRDRLVDGYHQFVAAGQIALKRAPFIVAT